MQQEYTKNKARKLLEYGTISCQTRNHKFTKIIENKNKLKI